MYTPACRNELNRTTCTHRDCGVLGNKLTLEVRLRPYYFGLLNLLKLNSMYMHTTIIPVIHNYV